MKWIGLEILRERVKMKIIIFVLMFLLIGALFIISENNLALKDADSRVRLKNIYISWVNKIFDNSKDLVGYVVKLDWLPKDIE